MAHPVVIACRLPIGMRKAGLSVSLPHVLDMQGVENKTSHNRPCMQTMTEGENWLQLASFAMPRHSGLKAWHSTWRSCRELVPPAGISLQDDTLSSTLWRRRTSRRKRAGRTRSVLPRGCAHHVWMMVESGRCEQEEDEEAWPSLVSQGPHPCESLTALQTRRYRQSTRISLLMARTTSLTTVCASRQSRTAST
jgi:hypothetical protein